MKSIIIIGAQSSFISEAIETCELAGYKEIYCVDNLNQLKIKEIDGYPVIHLSQIKKEFKPKQFSCCLHTPIYKEKIIKSLNRSSFEAISILHPNTIISKRSKISPNGVFIGAGTIVGSHTLISDYVLINRGALIGHDIKINKFSTIESGVSIGGFCIIDEKVYIGMNASILPKVKIGKNCVIAAGSVVREDVFDNTMVAGVPAEIKKRSIEGYLPV